MAGNMIFTVPLAYRKPIRIAMRLTGYTPTGAPGSMEGGPVDMYGKPLHTLQEYRDGKCLYVSVAMDGLAMVPYGTRIEMPEEFPGVEFRRVDTGGDFLGMGLTRADVCCDPGRDERGQEWMLRNEVNQTVEAIVHLEDSQ